MEKCIAIYLRVSLEDFDLKHDVSKDESNSIFAQRKLIESYIKGEPTLVGSPAIEFVDDGFTGTNFDRPGFQNMLKQVKAGHPFLVFASVTLLALVSFAGGLLLGISVNEGRHQRQREARLKEALSQLSGFAGTSVTNATALPANMLTPEQRRNVSVVVFQ